MEVQYQSHHAVISEQMRRRAERILHRVARRIDRPVDAVVRFEQDGPMRRVELQLHAAGNRFLVAEGRATRYGPALSLAGDRLLVQTTRAKRTRKERGRALSRT